jgi:hypothetical protein
VDKVIRWIKIRWIKRRPRIEYEEYQEDRGEKSDEFQEESKCEEWALKK